MARILGKDPTAYAKEREVFTKDLQQFHETRGTPYRRFPKISGHEIDLYLLYSLVTSQGGWIKVNSRNGWTDLYEQFHLPTKCVNGSVALKQIYLRYLDRWEKVHFLGEEADRGSDDDEESRHRRWSARALHSVPLTYNYQQHNIAESIRDYNHLSTRLYKASDYDRLSLSLISPLPNEQDFAINVCTLLSNDGKHTLKLEKCPRLLDYLLAHAGIFNHGSLRKLFAHCYSNIRRHAINNFWKDVLEDALEFLDLTNEDNFVRCSEVPDEGGPESKDSSAVEEEVDQNGLSAINVPMDTSAVNDQSSQSGAEVVCVSCESTSDCGFLSGENRLLTRLRFSSSSSDRELFCLGRSLGTQDYIGQRVLQIATIVRNLSFIDDNLPVLIKNQTFVRFLLLCANSRWAHLKNLGLDMLGNVAADFLVKDLHSDRLTSVLFMIVNKCLNSEDRSSCISALEVLNKLSQNEANEESLLRQLQSNIYKKVCSFLTLHDVMLLIYTLECLYSLSSLGERACNLIVNIHGVIDTLVSLVTVEGKSYGPKACIGMKLVETVPGGISAQQQTNHNHGNAASSASSSTVTTTTTVSAASSSTSASASTSISTTVAIQNAISTVKPLTQITPSRPVPIAPQRLIAIAPATTVTTTPTVQPPQVTQVINSHQLVHQQHAHQQAIQENEQFALSWLRATYEPCASGRIDHQELYKHYINSCAKIGRRGVIAPLHFPRCVRSVFGGTVGPNPVKPANSTDPQYYEGIKVMAHPHLSQALLGSNSSNSNNSNITITTTPAGPSKESQAGQSNTSLIKSLLATKVNNDCMTTVSMRTATDCQNVTTQVAARQQQQRLLAQQTAQTPDNKTNSNAKLLMETPKTSRLNGARQLFSGSGGDGDSIITSVTSTITNSNKNNMRDTPQPPPPLAPLSNQNRIIKAPKLENEDSDSTGNNSVASSSGLGTIGIGGISSTEEGDNSLTSFEGLLNGIPNIDNPLNLNDDSNSKDSVKNSGNGSGVITKNKPLMLADLLEKKVDKDPPILMNGVIGKELRIGDKGLELVENHIEKALKKDIVESADESAALKYEVLDDVGVKNEKTDEVVTVKTTKMDDSVIAKVEKMEEMTEVETTKPTLKRSASEDIVESEAKKPYLSTNNVNGSLNSPAPESVSSSNGDEGSGTVSTAAAKLFADIAADILEDEEEELMQQENQVIAPPQPEIPQPSVQQIIMDNNQQVLLAQPRQIIVSQPQIQSVIQSQLKTTQTGQTVIVQNSAQQRAPMVFQQSNTGQILLSQGLQGQVQLVASATQPGQYVLQAGGAQGTYMVAQPQTAVVHGQPQTVLVAQTAQQQGQPTKTIIILQQPAPNAATHHQKVVVTPQGQQVVVTQVQRPILQTSTVSNNVMPASIIKTTATPPIPQQTSSPMIATSNGAASGAAVVADVKQEDVKPPQATRQKIIRDLTSPFVCEWGDCPVETPFKTANEVYLHVCEMHCPRGSEEIVCQWDRCDNLKRKRFSLMTHLHDKHCNTEAMKISLTRRKQLSQSGKVETSTPAVVTPHPGYAPDAAFHAIKRHALEFVNPKELQDDNEGPVTKSIRLTASLILRNLVIYSGNSRRYLKPYEPHLANVALSNVESSRTIAQVLYDLNEGSSHR